MKTSLRILPCALLAAHAVLGVPQQLRAAPLSETKIIFEINATAGDGGVQIFLDAEGWNRLEVSDPSRQRIFDVGGSGSVGATGVTELFFESAEPSFQDLPLDQLLVRFPEGRYTFDATTVGGKR